MQATVNMTIYIKPLIKMMLDHPDENISSIITLDVFLYINFYLEVDSLYFKQLKDNSSVILYRYMLYQHLKTIGRVDIEKEIELYLNDVRFKSEELKPLFRNINKATYFNIENFQFKSNSCGNIYGNIYRETQEPLSYDLKLNFMMDSQSYSIKAAIGLLHQLNKHIHLLSTPNYSDLFFEVICLVKELSSIVNIVKTENLFDIENLSQHIDLISMIYE